MEFQGVFTFVERVVYVATGKRLDNLQRLIVTGTLMNKSYGQMAQEHGYTEGYLKDKGSQLWKIMSDTLEEDIKKTNFRSRVQSEEYSLHSENSANSLENSIQINNVVCSQISHLKLPNLSLSTSPVDLSEMPFCPKHDGRTDEINWLEKQILQNQSHLVGIAGLKGIGKTTLVVDLVEKIKNNFTHVAWRNLALYSSVNLLTDSLFESATVKDLLQYLCHYKCLIVLDQVEEIFSEGKLAGTYKKEYENLSKFFDIFNALDSQSCILIVGWEMPKQISNDRILQLSGLGQRCEKILKKAQLNNEKLWSLLIDKYAGNPLWLINISREINELFNGEVSKFLEHNIMTEELEIILEKHWQRLSESEKEIIYLLSKENQEISLDKLLKLSAASASNISKSVRSLLARDLIKKVEQESQFCLRLLPIIKQFIEELNSK